MIDLNMVSTGLAFMLAGGQEMAILAGLIVVAAAVVLLVLYFTGAIGNRGKRK